MDNVFEINNFNFDDLNLANPTPLSGGSYFTKLSTGNYSKNVYLQLPKSTTKQGIMKNNSKTYCDLMFNSSEKDLINWLENLESFCQNSIFKKKELWFHNNIELQDIEEMMNPIMRSYKSGKNFLVRAQIKSGKCNIYDENENVIDLEKLQATDEIIPLISLDGIKFSAKTFQIEINLIQIMKLIPQSEFEKNCLIKIGKPKNNNVKENIEVKEKTTKQDDIENFITENTIKDEEENVEVVSEKKESYEKENCKDNIIKVSSEENIEDNGVEDNGVEDNGVEDNGEEDNGVEDNGEEDNGVEDNGEEDNGEEDASNEDYESDEEYDKKPPIQIYNDTPETFKNLEEFELNIDDIDDIKDSVSLKKPNEVYFEIYKEARKRAKDLRRNTLAAYLEAKNIKTKYMLDEIDDSDDEFDYILTEN